MSFLEKFPGCVWGYKVPDLGAKLLFLDPIRVWCFGDLLTSVIQQCLLGDTKASASCWDTEPMDHSCKLVSVTSYIYVGFFIKKIEIKTQNRKEKILQIIKAPHLLTHILNSN